MTLSEFIAISRRHHRHQVLCSIAVLVAGLSLLLTFAPHLTMGLHQLTGMPYARCPPLIVSSGFLAVIAGTLFFSWWCGNRFDRAQCVHCNRALSAHGGIVIATGCCFHCGHATLDEIEDRKELSQLYNSMKEIHAADRAIDTSHHLALWTIAAFAVALGLLLAIDHIADLIANGFGWQWREAAKYGVMAIAVAIVGAVIWHSHRIETKPVSHRCCPRTMGAGSDSWITTASGHCPCCGGRMLLPVNPTEAQPTLNLSNFLQATRSAMRRSKVSSIGLMAALIAAAVAKAWIGPLVFYIALTLIVIVLIATLCRSDPRLRCVHCRGHLADPWRIVVASRCCPHCGGQVIAED